MYVEKIIIQNFRIFENAEVTFSYPPLRLPDNGVESTAPRPLENVNLFLGDNGSGKTSLCRALVISILQSILAANSGFRAINLVRHGEFMSEVKADLLIERLDNASSPATLKTIIREPIHRDHSKGVVVRRGTVEFLERQSDTDIFDYAFYTENHPGAFVVAYGANRRTERPEAYNEALRQVRYQRIASLFESHVGLIPIGQAYLQYQISGRWQEVADLVNRLLPDQVRLLPETMISNTEPAFDADGVQLPVESLSDGYRLFIGWLVDLLAQLARVTPSKWKLNDLSGVVIVDEVDLFLHPSWQRTVIRSLSETFPRLQFFFTTHSPIVAATLERHNVYLVERIAPHTAAVRQPTEKFAGRSIDEVLVRLFGLASPRSPELEKQLSNLADRAMEGDFEASLEYLRRLRVGVEGE